MADSYLEKAMQDVCSKIAEVTDGYAVHWGWVPELNKDELTHDSGRMYVHPLSTNRRLASRGCSIREIELSLKSFCYLSGQSIEQMAISNQVLVESIVDGIVGQRTGGQTNLLCLSIAQTVALSAEHWREYRVAATFLTMKLES